MLELLDSNSRRSVVICGGEQGDMALPLCVCVPYMKPSMKSSLLFGDSLNKEEHDRDERLALL